MMGSLEENKALLAEATALKDSGNQHYQAGDHRQAMRCYHKCLLKARCLVQLPSALSNLARSGSKRKSESEGEAVEKEETSNDKLDVKTNDHRHRLESESEEANVRTAAGLLLSSCYNNLAACLLATEDRGADAYLRAVDYADKVLDREPGNEKALFRKAKALHMAGELEKASEAYGRCTNNAEATRLKRSAESELAAKRKAAKEEIAANFAKVANFAAAPAPAHNHHNHHTANGHVPPGNQ